VRVYDDHLLLLIFGEFSENDLNNGLLGVILKVVNDEAVDILHQIRQLACDGHVSLSNVLGTEGASARIHETQGVPIVGPHVVQTRGEDLLRGESPIHHEQLMIEGLLGNGPLGQICSRWHRKKRRRKKFLKNELPNACFFLFSIKVLPVETVNAVCSEDSSLFYDDLFRECIIKEKLEGVQAFLEPAHKFDQVSVIAPELVVQVKVRVLDLVTLELLQTLLVSIHELRFITGPRGEEVDDVLAAVHPQQHIKMPLKCRTSGNLLADNVEIGFANLKSRLLPEHGN